MASAPNRVLHPAVVVAVQHIAPHMRRITVQGDPLRAMAADLPGQWMKVFFPMPPSAKRHGRAYTIRRHDARAGTMELDFVLHGDNGVASSWAGQAKPGEMLELAGPREGYEVDPSRTNHLLIGDSTSLPAIACILERLPAEVTPVVVIEVADAEEGMLLPRHPRSEAHILVSGDRLPGTTGALEKTVRTLRLPGAPQVWLAGEAGMMRSIYAHLRDQRQIEPAAIDASGYWRMGVEDHRD